MSSAAFVYFEYEYSLRASTVLYNVELLSQIFLDFFDFVHMLVGT